MRPSPTLHLTPREEQILDLIWQGFPTKAIALQLRLSTKTIDHSRAQLRLKLQATNTAQLLQAAFTHGLLRPA